MTTSSDKKISSSLVIGVIALVLTCVGIAITYAASANTKSDNAIQRVSNVEGDIKAINTKLDLLTTYFKLTPRKNEQ